MIYELYPKICLLCKIGYAHWKGLAKWPVLYINLIQYSNKYQLFCTRKQSAGGRGAI